MSVFAVDGRLQAREGERCGSPARLKSPSQRGRLAPEAQGFPDGPQLRHIERRVPLRSVGRLGQRQRGHMRERHGGHRLARLGRLSLGALQQFGFSSSQTITWARTGGACMVSSSARTSG